MPIILSFIAIFSSFFLVPNAVHAYVEYSAAPLVIDVDAEARDILSRKITLTNTGTAPVTIFPSVNNISVDEGGTIQEFLSPVESDRTTSLSSWIEFSRMGIDLKPGDVKTLDITFRINPSPASGVYHAFIGFGNGRNRDEAEAQVKTGQAPGTVVTLTIKENKLEFLKLSRFVIDRFITSTGNQAAVYIINNPGDEVLVPSGEIIFYDNKGLEVGALKVNAEGQSLQPGEEREFTAEVPVSGMFGKYKAFLNVEYGNTERASVQDTSFFYVMPLKTLLIVFGILGAVVILLALFIHRRYFDDDVLDDADAIPVRLRESTSDPKHHDIDLTKQ